jgi:hypothetical protein
LAVGGRHSGAGWRLQAGRRSYRDSENVPSIPGFRFPLSKITQFRLSPFITAF